jgi:hypothetical protein
MADLVQRLRDWERIYPEDQDEPDHCLYLKAADRIEELETQRKEMIFKLALSDLALQRIENISGRFVGSDEKSEALKEIQEFCVQVLKTLGDSDE